MPGQEPLEHHPIWTPSQFLYLEKDEGRAESRRQGTDQLQKHFCVRTEAVRCCLCFEENCRGLCREGDSRDITSFLQCPLKRKVDLSQAGEGGEFRRTSPSSWGLTAAEGCVPRAPQSCRATTGVCWPHLSLGPWLLRGRAGPRAMVGTQAPTPPSRASNITGAPDAQGCLSGTPAEIRSTPLPKSTTTSRPLPRPHVVSVTPPGSHRVPGSWLCPHLRLGASQDLLVPSPAAPKPLLLVQSHWPPSPPDGRVTGRERGRAVPGAPGVPGLLHPPQPLPWRGPVPRAPCPCAVTAPLAASPASSHPRWPRALRVPAAVPPRSPGPPHSPQPRRPRGSRSRARLPINSSVQRAGLGTAAPPGAHTRPGGGVAGQGTVPAKERAAGRLSPREKQALEER